MTSRWWNSLRRHTHMGLTPAKVPATTDVSPMSLCHSGASYLQQQTGKKIYSSPEGHRPGSSRSSWPMLAILGTRDILTIHLILLGFISGHNPKAIQLTVLKGSGGTTLETTLLGSLCSSHVLLSLKSSEPYSPFQRLCNQPTHSCYLILLSFCI